MAIYLPEVPALPDFSARPRRKGYHHLQRVTATSSRVIILFLVIVGLYVALPVQAQASCGSASCFLNVGNQPGVQPKDLVRVDLSYSYVPQTGPNNRVAAVSLENNRQILAEHQEFQTLNQRLQLDVNYGLTDNLTLQVTLPVIFREHDHRIGVGEKDAGAGEFENFDATGLGDIRVSGKYGFLPSLRSLVSLGVGIDFPTGNFEARNSEGNLQEPTLQIGRGNYGVVAQLYQSYELMPHKLNQFFSYTYEHTFENKFDYQFGDRHIVSGGLIYQVMPKVQLSGQLNWRYAVHDVFRSDLRQARLSGPAGPPIVIASAVKDRSVANTGSTSLMFTPGITLHLDSQTSWYFFSQTPLVQDFNGGLEQGTSFLTGFVRFFNVGGGS